MRIREVLAALTATALLAQVALVGALPAQAAGAKSPVNVGLVYSKTGFLASYGAQYAEGFAIGLDYATHGTGMAGGHKIVVTERDDAGDPAKAVATAKELIGQGYKIIAGSTASGVALQLAPVAKENNVLFISGAAAADAVTGNNRNTFRSGRQTYQDVLTAGTIVGNNLRGKKVVVYAQDSAFGQANLGAVRIVLGGAGADVTGVMAPLSANDFAPFSQKIKDAKPDLLFPAWAGATAPAMWKGLDDSGVFASTRVKKQNKVPDLFDPDGFVGAEMVVRAIEKADGEDVGKMISALEGWTFEAPKGKQTIRAADHAMLQPMFVAKLQGSGSNIAPQLVRTVPLEAVSPPVHPFK